MKLRPLDTITAIATPLGEGAISVLRISGADSMKIVDRIFRGVHLVSDTPGYTIRHGTIVDMNGLPVDEVLVSVFLAPSSYTGENCVEISCHGGAYVTKKVLSTLTAAGARQADPGEFTKRAFLNGKMDLSQAEAVSDLIRSRSERALRNSKAQLNGALGEAVQSLKDELIRVVSLLELQLDFSNDDVPIATKATVEESINHCVGRLQTMLSSFSVGKIVRDGASVAIVGEPNVGKSSLFNRLLMENRSIVSSIPGTTRDFLEESIDIEGLQVKLIDTAGLRVAGDDIEAEGIARTKAAMESADVILLVEDARRPRELSEIHLAGMGPSQAARVIVVLNKIDLVTSVSKGSSGDLRVSALTGLGVDELRKKISLLLIGDTSKQDSDLYISSARHQEALRSAASHVSEAMRSVASDVPTEFVVSDLRLSLDALSLITGEVTTDEILNSIFSQFCIGK